MPTDIKSLATNLSVVAVIAVVGTITINLIVRKMVSNDFETSRKHRLQRDLIQPFLPKK